MQKLNRVNLEPLAVSLKIKNRDLAAGTSTSGMTNKRYGRIGHVPIMQPAQFLELVEENFLFVLLLLTIFLH